MDDFVKQRLIGAVVIIGLAIIFLPAILDRDEESSLADTMQIPPRPDIAKDINIEKALTAKQRETEQQEIVLPKPLAIEPDEIEQKPIAELKDEIKASPKQAPEAKQAPTEAKPSTKAKPESASKPKATVKANIKPKPKASKANNKWVIQLGSFSQRANAEKLKEKLKNDVGNLYIEKVDIPGGTTYRLRLGDFTDKDKAIAQRRKIKDKYGIAGVVMAKE